ncbi:MAG: hypothetical protein JXA49_08065 [Actinobacteria bacterium]|nr:hypothetical protein [Actinomycetota bacterium]
MRILICHAYFLEGSRGDRYVQNIARALCRAGHQLVVMCQEDDPNYDFVSTLLLEQVGGINPHVAWDRQTDYKGSCMIYRADVGKLLPVYAIDSYPEFEVREYAELTGNEIEEYVGNYRRVITRLIDQFVPEVMLVNHALVLPYAVRPVAEAAGVPYFVTTCLEELDDPVFEEERFRVFAAGGFEGSSGAVVDNLNAEKHVFKLLGEKAGSWKGAVHSIPPGVDVDPASFRGTPLEEVLNIILKAIENRMSRVTVVDFMQTGKGEDESENPDTGISLRIEEIRGSHPEGLPDTDIADKFRKIIEKECPFIMYAGELTEAGGAQFIVPALPFIVEEHPEARILICGSGNSRGILELMLEALGEGDIGALRELCRYGNDNCNEPDKPFSPVLSFLDQLKSDGLLTMYEQLCKGLVIRDTAVFSGHLYREEYLEILPYARGLLVPSLDPESSRTTVLEALGAGVIPVAPRHPALDEILETVEHEWGDSMLLGNRDDIVSRIARACRLLLKAPYPRVEAWGRQAKDITAAKYSWDAVVQRMSKVFEGAATD